MLTSLKHKLHANKIIWALTIADCLTWGAFAVLTALSGLYLEQKMIIDDVVRVVGLGSAIFFALRAIIQLPAGKYIDDHKGTKDEIMLLAIGSGLMAVPYFLMPVVSQAYMYFCLQAILGVGAGINIITWRKLFAKNLDKNHEGVEYATYDIIVSIVIAVTTAVGGYLANLGIDVFSKVLVSMGLLTLGGAIVALGLLKLKAPKKDLN